MSAVLSVVSSDGKMLITKVSEEINLKTSKKISVYLEKNTGNIYELHEDLRIPEKHEYETLFQLLSTKKCKVSSLSELPSIEQSEALYKEMIKNEKE